MGLKVWGWHGLANWLSGKEFNSQWRQLYYCPHPKDGWRYCFQFVCQSTSGLGRWGGTPSQVWGYPIQDLMVGGYPIQVWKVGVPHPGLGGGYPIQVWMVKGTPASSGWWGVPRVPFPHHQDLVGVPLNLGWGTPTIKTWPGYPPPWDGVPPTIKTWLGYP